MNRKHSETPTPQHKHSDVTIFLIILAAILTGILLLWSGFYLGTKHKTVSTLTPTQFPAATNTPQPTHQATPTGTTFISSGPNPASAFCTQQGGKLSIQTRGDGGQYGLCAFDSGYACEEWAMFRGECPIGGLRTTGYDTIEQKYCAWNGGSTLAVPNAQCTFPSGTTCDDAAFYNGTCTK